MLGCGFNIALVSGQERNETQTKGYDNNKKTNRKTLRAAGIEITDEIKIERDEIEICVGYYGENGFGQVNERKTKALANKVSNAVGGWGGFSTGYGSRMLRKDYIAPVGDWNDKSSSLHY